MQSCISAKNFCPFAVSVFADGDELFPEILPFYSAPCRKIDCGSRRITVFNSRGKLFADIWLSVPPGRKSTLEISPGCCRVI